MIRYNEIISDNYYQRVMYVLHTYKNNNLKDFKTLIKLFIKKTLELINVRYYNTCF